MFDRDVLAGDAARSFIGDAKAAGADHAQNLVTGDGRAGFQRIWILLDSHRRAPNGSPDR